MTHFNGRLLLVALTAGSFFVVARAHDASALGITDPPDCPDGWHLVGRRCVKNPPPPPPTLAQCEATDPMNPIAGCKDLLTQALSDAYAQAQAAGAVKPMYVIDPATYPANLASTTPPNVTTGAFTGWNGASLTTKGSEVTYSSVIASGLQAARATHGAGALDAVYSVSYPQHGWMKTTLQGIALSTQDPLGQQGSGRPVPQLSPTLKFDMTAQSCDEYVWKLWHNFTLPEDLSLMCGGDAACAVDTLDVPGGPGDTSVGHVVEPSALRRGDPTIKTIPARQERRAKNPFLGASANYFFVQDDTIRWLDANHTTQTCVAPWRGPYAATTIYSSNDPGYSNLNDAAKQAELAQARTQMLAQYTYSYGVPQIGGNDTPFATEFKFIRQMMADTIHAPAPISRAERLAMRERVRRFQGLIDAYNTLTTFSCSAGQSGSTWVGAAAPHATPHSPSTRALAPRSSLTSVARTVDHGAHASAAPLSDAMSGGGGGGGDPGHGTTLIQPPTLTIDQRVAAARAVQDQILEAILQEQERGEAGCFSTTRRDCDWFPEDAAPRAVGLFADERERDFQECVRWMGSANTPFPDTSFQGKTTDEITARIEQLHDDALRALNAAPGVDAPIGAQSPGGAASKGRQAMGQVIAGNKYIGDSDWFGGGFRYGAFWKVSPAKFEGPLRDDGNGNSSPAPCDLNGQVHAELHARADVLKSVFDTVCSVCEAQFENVDLPPGAAGVASQNLKNFTDSTITSVCGGYCPLHYRMQHLVDAEADLKSTFAGGNVFSGDFFFAGEQVWQDPNETINSPIHESYPGTPEGVDAIDTTVWVSVVPVTLMVRGEVHYGVDLDASMYNSRNCGAVGPSIALEGTFRPWAYVDAIGSVGIGFDFAQAGVRGKVRVVDATLPMWGKVWVDQNFLNAAMDAHLDIGIADGSMSAFAKIGLWEVEHELFSWRGYHDTIRIVNYQLTPISMPIFDQATWDHYTSGAP